MNEDLMWSWGLQILAVYVGYRWGQFVAAKRIINRLIEDPKEIMQSINELRRLRQESPLEQSESSAGSRDIKVERVGDCIYLWADDNGEFLAQAQTLQEALAIVEQRFPNQQFKGHISKEQLDALGISIK